MIQSHRSPLAVASLAASLLLGSSAAMAATSFTYDFESGTVDAEWSMISPGSLAVDTTPSGRKFLGLNDSQNLGFSNDAVKLTLTGLPSYSGFTLSFDLYAIQSLDGNQFGYGPDLIGATATSGSLSLPLLHTTFSNIPSYNQSYPGNFFSSNPAQSGSAEQNSLGYSYFGDSVYQLSFGWGLGQTNAPLEVVFFASGLQGIGDESWGIDNVRIELSGTPAPVPLPPAVWLLGTGLISLAGIARRNT